MTLLGSVPEVVARSAAALAAEQARVAALVAGATAGSGWQAGLRPADRRRLVRLGHFPRYATELDWTAGDVAGHLRDSARIFTERLHLMCTENEPLVADFVTDDPGRLADYRSTPPAQLADELRLAQAELLQTVAAIRADELARGGLHPVDGPISVAGILDFLPAHQLDHAEQLAAILRAVGR